jgi:arylsulfatase A-like enzyme
MRSTLLNPPRCFTQELKDAGYHVSWPTKLDFNFDPPENWVDSREPWVDSPAPSQPFFLYENFNTTHESSMWRDAETQKKIVHRYLSKDQFHNPAGAPVPRYFPDTPEIREQLVKYYDSLSAIDHLIGLRLRWLEDQGLLENTIVIFLSDHGRGLPREKRWCYEAGLHMPLIVRWPGAVEPGSVVDDLVGWVDIAPTILSLTGTEIPEHYQGQAFLGKEKASPREYVFAGRDRMDEVFDRVRVVRDKRWHYIRNDFPGLPWAQRQSYMEQQSIMPVMREMNAKGKLEGAEACFFQERKPAEELYDAVNDPGMVNNLAGDPAKRETIDRMSSALEEMRLKYGDFAETSEEDLIEQGLVGDRLEEYRERLQPLADHLQIGPEPIPVTMNEATEYRRGS